jgi:DNA-binding HxlR family transcriptional regulator
MALKLRKSNVTRPPMCALTQCMALLRGAWAPNVIWHLREGARRFGELRVDIPLVTAKILTARLRELEDRGLIERRPLPTSPPSGEYSLTNLGRDLLPAIDAIVKVGKGLKGIDLEIPDSRPLWKSTHRLNRKTTKQVSA